MKILVSWSGELSHEVALHIRDWLPVVLPFAEVWVSSEDIPKGSRWGTQLATELKATHCGIVCVTPANLEEPWLNFEAGALSKTVERAQVHPFLLGVRPGDLTGPLSQFQATEFNRDDVRKLVCAINDAGGEVALPRERLDRNFETCWPDLQGRLAPLALQASNEDVTSIPAEASGRAVPPSDPLTEEDISVLRAMIHAEGEQVFPKKLAAVLGMHPERAKHIMEKLESLGLLHAAHNYIYGTSWILSRDGRTELVRRNLL